MDADHSLVALMESLDLERFTFVRKDTLWVLVKAALQQQEITLGRGAEILGLPLEVMREVANSWFGEPEPYEILIPEEENEK